MQEGKRITTIEGLERDGKLHPLQSAFIEHDGFQCGFCTSGQIMSGVAMIEEAKAGWPSAATADVRSRLPSRICRNAEIRERMSGNLCRCACYPEHRGRRRRSRRGGAEPCIPLRFRELMIRRKRSRPMPWIRKLAFIAGGTDLIGLMKDRAALPERLLDINGLPDMARIEALPEAALRIGALARMSDVAADMEVRRRFPVIAEALLFAASGQLRNMASIGGNIMQRTRCAYFRDDDGSAVQQAAARAPAVRRSTASIAITRSSDGLNACVATNPSDLAVALAALDAIVIVRGKAGERSIPFADFHRLPGSTPERDNVLGRGDLIVAIEVPARVEAAPRTTLRFATANPTSSRSSPWRPRSRPMADASARRGSRWAASPTSRGGSRRLKRRCAEFRWTTLTRSESAIAHIVRRCPPARSQCLQGRAGAARRPARIANRGSTHMNAVGQPISRVDGRLKVTGGARYTADIPLADAVHAAIVYSTIANGRTVSIDTSGRRKGARRARCAHAPQHAAHEPTPSPGAILRPQGQTYLPLQDDEIHYAGQPVALVVADNARSGDLCRHADQSRSTRPIRPSCSTGRRRRRRVEPPQRMWPLSSSVGDADKAIRGRRGQDRADLHDVGSPSQPDGAARDAGGLGRGRHADALRLDPDGRRHEGSWFRSCSVFRRRKSTSCANSWAADSAASPGRGRTLCWPRSPRRW